MRYAPLLLGLLLLLHGCGLRQTPALEPVRAGSGGSGDFEEEITASTNCAEVGEMVTFTVNLANRTEKPLTLTGAPLFDITLQPFKWTRAGAPPSERWSESGQYPANVNPVLQAGEQRSYTWQWLVTPRFAQQGTEGNNLLVSYSMGETIFNNGNRTPAGTTTVLVSIGKYVSGAGSWPCSELRRPWFSF